MLRTIFHIDMDAFFASIEQRDNPAYRGKPVIVGAEPGRRGVVCAASYEARKFNVRSALPISVAQKRCPQGIFVRPRMDVYSHESAEIMRIMESFSPCSEQVSVDEAFLDMTGSTTLLGSPEKAARTIAARIYTERGLTASIGIAPNKYLAKIASDLNKPNGITLTPFALDAIIEWLAPMPVGRVWGVGTKTLETLLQKGIATIGDLQSHSLSFLSDTFGAMGENLFALCRGIDTRPVENKERVKSISREYTFNADSKNPEEWKHCLFELAQDVARQARHKVVKGSTVVLTWRRPDFSRHSKRKTLPYPTNVAKFIYECGLELLAGCNEPALRLIGIGITGLDPLPQTNLFAEEESVKALEITEALTDSIIDRFGPSVIAKGREITLNKKQNSIGEHL